MGKRGRNMYVPSIVIDEIEDIKIEEDIGAGAEAFRKLAKHARIGRELDRIRKLDFRHRPLVDNEKKKKRGLF